MKKFLVLALVLSIASLATAGIDLGTVSGLSYEVSGNTVTVSGTAVTGYLISLQADNNTEISNVVVDAAFTAVNNAGAWYGSYYVWMGASASNIDAVTGTILTFDYTSGASLINIVYGAMIGASEAYIAGQPVALDGFSMTVPEPMTMGLLGLGALVLRRKK